MTNKISKLEKKLVGIGLGLILAFSVGMKSYTNFFPITNTAEITNVTTTKYARVITTKENGLFRNESSWIYKKNPEQLQEKAKSLIGQKVKIKSYGYTYPIDCLDRPKRNLIDIEN